MVPFENYHCTICYQKVPLCCLALANYGVFNLSVISSPFSIIGSDRRANTCGSTTTRITYCRLLTLLLGAATSVHDIKNIITAVFSWHFCQHFVNM